MGLNILSFINQSVFLNQTSQNSNILLPKINPKFYIYLSFFYIYQFALMKIVFEQLKHLAIA